jgi:RHH-type proline utilization regulon transcriptional repressor/proline dehydrogenase/delta 1-pyrroline-5-carboxylate dehydrogenase
MFLGWRPKLELHAETSGKNAIVVTAAADLDAAVGDLVRSAFGHAGQKCSAASLGILEASVYDDPRFCRQLADAVSSLRPGSSTELSTTMGPLITAPQGVLRDALTRLGPGERWLVEPYQIGDNPHLWSPGVKLGVRPGSSFHLTECFGPVLGLMRARDLDEAIAFQNQTDYGLTAGLHSLDPAEIAYWRERVEAGNLYVNRHTTGAIVSRQPFGGWKRSSVGPSVKAGGPNYVSSLGRFELSVAAMDKVAFLSRAKAIYDGELAHPSDVSGLRAEANVFRYRPLRSLCVRVAAGFDDDDLDVVLRTAAIVGVATEVSLASERGGLARFGVVEDDAGLVARMKTVRPARLRLLGSFDPELKLALLDAGLSVDDVAFVRHPRLELHHLLAEQAVSETRHRYGNVTTRRPGVADTP